MKGAVIRDFAKSTMVDLMLRQLKRSHPQLVPPSTANFDAIRQASVPLKLKGDLLEVIWQNAGPLALLEIGQGIREVQYDPIWLAANRSDTPAILLNKWRRFEEFAHSRNRVQIEFLMDQEISCRRYTVNGGVPSLQENLLICGLIIALLENIGCLNLRCEMNTNKGRFCLRSDGAFQLPDDLTLLDTSNWIVSWKGLARKSSESLACIEAQVRLLERSNQTNNSLFLRNVLRLLLEDPSRQWQLDELAQASGSSRRSLQRRLAECGLNFSKVTRLVRIHEACRLLDEGLTSITGVAFCAGFSDSAHLSRDFRASMGMSPTQYRELID